MSILVGADAGYRTKDCLYVRKQYANLPPSSFGYDGPALKLVILTEEQFHAYRTAQLMVDSERKKAGGDNAKVLGNIKNLSKETIAAYDHKAKLETEIDDLERRIATKKAKMAAKIAREAEAKNISPSKKVEPSAPPMPPSSKK